MYRLCALFFLAPIESCEAIGAADIWGCMMRKVICLPVHRCTFYFSQMPIPPFTDAHLYVYRCRAVELPLPSGKATTGLW